MNQPQSQVPLPQAYDDEIDLFELAQNIWQEKILVVAVGAVVTLLALAYALWVTPVYQASAVIKPPAIKDLDELNGTGVYTLSPDDALRRVGAALESYDVRFEFFRDNQALFADMVNPARTLDQNFEQINGKSLKLLQPDEKKDNSFSKYVGLQFEYPKQVEGADIVNGLVRHAIDRERSQLADDLNTVIKNRLETINKQLHVLRTGYMAEKSSQIAQLTEEDALKQMLLTDELEAIRQSLKTRRENRIKQLDEAIAIAASLGIKKPTTRSGLEGTDTRVSGSVIKTEVNSQQLPLYFMGTEALDAEKATLLSRENDDFTSDRVVEIQQSLKLLEHNRQIEILKSRQNEDLFLKELAEKEREIARLKSINPDLERLQLVRIDQHATRSASAIKPKKVLIVAVGVVLGGMLGIFAALIRSAVRKRKAIIAAT